MSTDRERETILQFSICAAFSIWLWISAQETRVSARSAASLVRYAIKIGYRVKQSHEQRQGKRGKETNYNSCTKWYMLFCYNPGRQLFSYNPPPLHTHTNKNFVLNFKHFANTNSSNSIQPREYGRSETCYPYSCGPLLSLAVHSALCDSL
jgi:hypothetical protein